MASLWMLAAAFAFAVMGIFVKLGAQTFSAAELVFWRSFLTAVASLAMLWRRGRSVRSPRIATHAKRGVSGFVSLFLFFHALTVLPVTLAMTLSYTSPLFVAILFTLLSRERPGGRLVVSLLLGFAGTLVLLRPTITAEQVVPALLGIASGATAAVAYWNVQLLSRADEPEERIVFYFGFFSALGAAVWMLPERWTPVTLDNALPLAGVGVFGTVGQIFLTRAWGGTRPLVTAALTYSGIVFSALLALAVFGEKLPLAAWGGVALIVVAGIMAARIRPRPPPGTRADVPR